MMNKQKLLSMLFNGTKFDQISTLAEWEFGEDEVQWVQLPSIRFLRRTTIYDEKK